MHSIYTTLVYNPLYNGFILLIDAVRFIPWLDVGMVVILFTIIVRLILYPLSRKAARTQVVMRQAEPELAAIKEKYKNDRQALAVQTMAFYKEKKINPFSMFFLLIIQLPILIALYHIFYSSGLSQVSTDILYSFVSAPPAIGTHFLGIFDVTQKSWILAITAAVTQYYQIGMSTPPARRDAEGRLTQESMMHTMMRFMMPAMILLISSNLASALAIYWTTSNLFMICQELYVRRQIAKEKAA
ncbi:MAG TPA: YidC/Oxa1 family membrane protein insertase [Candidatus Paceibacterota bacterium]|nr:YidC/Oxa1 family membrane protein insertase [Candidatus Paceibacterota bacterium]